MFDKDNVSYELNSRVSGNALKSKTVYYSAASTGVYCSAICLSRQDTRVSFQYQK
jgi:methylphosphotriester-DNA--protein-cysteine methyltransferase